MITLRSLRKSDFNDILNWRNDLESRNNAIKKKKIGIQEHNKWASKLLKNKNNKLFMVLSNKKKIGFVRYEYGYYRNFLVSIHLDQKYRNNGLGYKLLQLTQKNIDVNKYKRKLFAKINKDNLRSIKTFEKANYTLFKECKNYFVFTNSIFD